MADIPQTKFNSPWTVANIEAELNGTKAARGNGTMTEALAAKQDVLTFDNEPTENSANPVKSGGVFDAIANFITLADVFGYGLLIEDNTDLNTITAIGKYYGGNSAGNSCSNLPIPKGTFNFTLEVKQVTPSAIIQSLKVCNQTNDPYIFIRRRTGSTWQSWYKFEGVQV